ncbi:MAG: site-specific integrase, partial [Pseudomonadota bacterium]
LRTGHNESGTNKTIQVLKGILIDAEKNDYIIKSPLRAFSRLKVKKRPPTYWNENEINQFLVANKNDANYYLYVVALNTGMRRGELAGLCWDKVLFNRNLLEVARSRDRDGLHDSTKTKTTRFVPMNDLVKIVLNHLFQKRTVGHNFVFTKKNGAAIEVQHIYRDFKSAMKNAGIEKKIRFHDLRHTFASHFMMKVGRAYDLQKILGHTQFEMTQIYAHVSEDHVVESSQKVSFGSVTHEATIDSNSPFSAPRPKIEVEGNLVLLAK